MNTGKKELYLYLAMIGLVGGIALFICTDYGLGEDIVVEAQVTDKQYTPAKTSTHTYITQEGARTSTTHTPEQWLVIVEVPEKGRLSLFVSETKYYSLDLGTWITATARKGQWTKSLYCASLL